MVVCPKHWSIDDSELHHSTAVPMAWILGMIFYFFSASAYVIRSLSRTLRHYLLSSRTYDMGAAGTTTRTRALSLKRKLWWES